MRTNSEQGRRRFANDNARQVIEHRATGETDDDLPERLMAAATDDLRRQVDRDAADLSAADVPAVGTNWALFCLVIAVVVACGALAVWWR